jgi:hypothetical protein
MVQIDFVDNRHNLQPLLKGKPEVGDGARLHTLHNTATHTQKYKDQPIGKTKTADYGQRLTP